MKYNINRRVKVEFNPFDGEFARRFSDVVCRIEGIYKAYQTEKAQLIKNTDPVKLYELRCSTDRQICTLIDGLFGAPVSAAVFEGDSVSPTTDTGLPCWFVLMRAMAKQIKSPLSGACRENYKGVRRWQQTAASS